MSRITRSSSALMTAALLASTSGTHAAIRYVKAGPVNGNGTSWASAYNNVQSAITASVPSMASTATTALCLTAIVWPMSSAAMASAMR